MDINQEIQSAMPAVMERIKRDTLERIEREAVNAATEVAIKAAKDWALENLVPEIKAQLEAGKPGMVESAKKTAGLIGDALGEALAAQVTKTLSNSHTVSSIAQSLFRGY